MSIKKNKNNHTDKKYYVLDSSFVITPVKDYKFNKKETNLQSLVDSECFFRNPKFKSKEIKLNKMISEMGFEWDPLSEPGHMRQLPHATTILEALEKYSWMIVKKFSNEQNIPLYRVSGGELFDPNVPELKKQISLISKGSGIYGSNQYNVIINKKEGILRYNACMQKLSIVKGFDLYNKDLPIGLFEISKSYRFEDEKELQLCKRIRSFHIPEVDIINKNLSSSLKIALISNIEIINQIEKLDPEYELFCSVTQDFLKENFDFLKEIVKSVNKSILLAVYEDNNCKDGVKIDIEYKVFDTLKSPLEIATCLVDDGSTEFSFNLKSKTKEGVEKPVSILHIVFPFGSIERFAYFLIDRANKKEIKTGFKQLPFWASPIQVRIITCEKDSLKDAKKLAKELDLLNFRVDIDDRKISYIDKKKTKDLVWIPYVITIGKNNNNLNNLIIENKIKMVVEKNVKKNDLIKKLELEYGRHIVVPLYVPMLLSKRRFLNQ